MTLKPLISGAVALVLGLGHPAIAGVQDASDQSTLQELQTVSPAPMRPVEFIEMTRLNDPTPSPDGRYVAYLRSQTDWDENKAYNRLVLIDRTTRQNVPLFAPQDDTEDMSAPDWLPDSQHFIVVLDRKIDKPKDETLTDISPENIADEQAYIFDLQTRTLERLTAHLTDISNVQVAPDGSGFFFTAKAPLPENEDRLLDNNFTISAYEVDQAAEVWFFDFATQQTHRHVSGDFYMRGYSLSRDGTQILHMRAPGPNGDDRHHGDLWLQDITSGTEQRLTQNRYAESHFRLSPDNKSVAYIATVNEQGEGYYEDNLFIHRIGEIAPTLALADLPMELQDVEWGPNSDSLFLTGNTGLRTQLYEYEIAEDTLHPLTVGDHVVQDWAYAPDSGIHAFIRQDAASPGEVYILDETSAYAPLTSEYADWPQRYAFGKQEPFNWTGQDGVRIEGLLIYPVGYVAGTPVPLITITHGGPRSSSQFGSWNTSRAVPVFSGADYAVFLPNHRGGTGYGDAFMRDMVGGYFTNAAEDVMRGIDALIEAGIADPDALIKQGWSAGGHMTNWLITQTDRFKAASSGAGVADWVSMYGESDIRHNRTLWFGAAPWDANADLSRYINHSPIFDGHAITTPTIFYNGKNDARVPPTQSILMYHAAKAAGAETRLYLAPRQPHGFHIPGYRLFKVNTDLEWYAKHLNRTISEADLPKSAYARAR